MPKANACWDHLGRKYKSHAEMCKSWGVGKRTFCHRIQCGWSIEAALVNKPGGGQMSASQTHIWQRNGRDECGDPLIRCVRCCMLQSWPGATSPCSGAIRTALEEKEKKLAKKRKHQQMWLAQKAAQDKQRQSIAAERAEWSAERKPK